MRTILSLRIWTNNYAQAASPSASQLFKQQSAPVSRPTGKEFMLKTLLPAKYRFCDPVISRYFFAINTKLFIRQHLASSIAIFTLVKGWNLLSRLSTRLARYLARWEAEGSSQRSGL